MTGGRQELPPVPILGTLMTSGRIRLLVAFTLFAGWLGWLGYAALRKTHAPVVSKAQVAGVVEGQGPAVVAVVSAGPDEKPTPTVEVVKTLTAGTAPGPTVEVVNLAEVRGFDGPGEYLLLLVPVRGSDKFRVAGPQPSPGYDLSATGKPTIYLWSDPAVRAQAEKLLP